MASLQPAKKTGVSFSSEYSNVSIMRMFRCMLVLLGASLVLDRCVSWWHWSFRDLVLIAFAWCFASFILFTRVASATFQRTIRPRWIDDISSLFTQLDLVILTSVYTFGTALLVHLLYTLLDPTKDLRLRLFIANQRLDIPQINLDTVFVWSFGSALGLWFSTHRNSQQRWVMRLHAVQQSPFFQVKSNLRASAHEASKVSFSALAGTWTLFFFFRSFIYWISVKCWCFFFNVLDAPIIGFGWWHLRTFLRLGFAGSLIIFLYLFVDDMCDACFSRVDDLVSGFANPLDLLLEGMQFEKDHRVQGMAYGNLVKGLRKNKSIQQALFVSKSQFDDKPWKKVRELCLKQVTDLTARIKNEYKTDEPARPAPAKPTPLPKQHIQLADNSNLYERRRSKKTSLDDRTGQVVSEWADKAEKLVPSPDFPLTRIFSRIRSTVNTYASSVELHRQLSRQRIAFFGKTKNRKIASVLGSPITPVLAIQALGNAIHVSVRYDPVGHIRYDLTLIANTLLTCMKQLDDYLEQPPAHYAQQFEAAPANCDLRLHAPYQLKWALQQSLFEITLSYPDQLKDGIVVEGALQPLWQPFLP
ncbi:hypothetical protein DM01DRAFT_1406840 [Hesseltinella vesiculosa]|uniref:Nucleoporin protein Ndc1-Nup n=1 Tax=Hesseltinella vesiculosa TaxID=101127 RepID=A0A1X2GK61_9FUNG|nr:hypothetical protein DM01DRAFT_1406840 [Hesseltinella vesiculosa]